MKRVLAGAALVLVVVGCSSRNHTSGGPATTTSHAQAVRGWAEPAKGRMQDLGIAMGKATFAAKSHDYAGLGQACQEGHDAAKFLQSHLPSPDKELTDAVQATLDDFDVAFHFCVAAVEDRDANEARHAGDFVNSAEGYLRTAIAIRDRIVNGSG